MCNLYNDFLKLFISEESFSLGRQGDDYWGGKGDRGVGFLGDQHNQFFIDGYRWIDQREKMEQPHLRKVLRLFRLVKMKNRILNPISQGGKVEVYRGIENKLDNDICETAWKFLGD